MPSIRQILTGLIFICTISCPLTWSQTTRPASAPAVKGPQRWEKEIAAFEKQDSQNPPPKGALLFTGASSIRMWKSLPQDFPNQTILNRGFGGSQIADATYYADRIIFPYEPKMIFFRAGGNDINAGKTADQAFADYKAFVAKVRTKLPDTPIVFISLSPAPKRWNERQENKKLNDLVEAYSKQTPGLKFCDVYDLTLTPDGQAREELFIADKLHFNAEGYKLLAERVRPFVPAVAGK